MGEKQHKWGQHTGDTQHTEGHSTRGDTAHSLDKQHTVVTQHTRGDTAQIFGHQTRGTKIGGHSTWGDSTLWDSTHTG